MGGGGLGLWWWGRVCFGGGRGRVDSQENFCICIIIVKLMYGVILYGYICLFDVFVIQSLDDNESLTAFE